MNKPAFPRNRKSDGIRIGRAMIGCGSEVAT
jgi:hypothetical protein